VTVLAAISSEWIKFRSVRSTLYTLAVTIFLCVGIGALGTYAERTHWEMAGFKNHLAFDPTRVSLFGFFFAEIAIGVIGVLVISSEYTSGLIRATLSALPHRVEALVAKATVLFLATLVVGEACAFVSFFVGQSILHGVTPTATLSTPGALRAVTLAGLSLSLLALFALGIGTMLRHTAGSITVFVSLLLVILLIVSALPSNWNVHIYPYLPEVLSQSMRSPSASGLGFNSFSPTVSTLVLASYAVGSILIGGVLLVRRDA
jgi:ABC-type transport system involved in multi-copper enzyme maturation permease subunit